MPAPAQHDVFICYPAAERDRAIDLKGALGEHGVSSFLAEVDLLPGDIVDEEIPRRLDESEVIVVLVSEHGMDWWQREQVARSIERIIDDRSARVIPLIIGRSLPDKAFHYGLARLHPLYWSRPDEVASVIARVQGRPASSTPDVAGPRVITDSAAHILIGGAFAEYASIEEDEHASSLTLATRPLTSEDEDALREALGQWRDDTVAFSTRAMWVEPRSTRFKHQGGSTVAELTFQQVTTRAGRPFFTEMAWGGPGRSRSADQIAELRARRLLLVEDEPYPDGLEMLVRGMGATGVERSPLPALLAHPLGTGVDHWQRIRLALLDRLVRSDCVERVAHLHLTIDGDRLIHIDFRGIRARRYSNVDPAVIQIQGRPSLS